MASFPSSEIARNLTVKAKNIAAKHLPPSADPFLHALHKHLSYETRKTEPHAFFRTEKERRRIWEITDRATRYIHDNGFANIVLIDKAARPFGVALDAYWKTYYPYEQPPRVDAVNPHGFRVQETPHTIPTREGGTITYPARSQADITEDFVELFSDLNARKDQPTLLFDICMHGGGSAADILRTMREAGFSDVKFGVGFQHAYHNKKFPVAFNALGLVPAQDWSECHPFKQMEGLSGSTDSVATKVSVDPTAVHQREALSLEIARIIEEQTRHAPKFSHA